MFVRVRLQPGENFTGMTFFWVRQRLVNPRLNSLSILVLI